VESYLTRAWHEEGTRVPLLALRFAYAFWKHTFALSKKLSGPTWIALAALNASIAATSFWASRALACPEIGRAVPRREQYANIQQP